jgi:DNA-binding transcriptional ArsR family regulator
LKDPDEFKAAVTYALSRFWDRYVKDEYSHCQSMQEQSVNHYKQTPPSGTAEEIFLEVCGRAYPKSHGPSLEQVQKIWFIPSCHCGPYVSITDAEGDGTLLVIVYNCRPSAESPRLSTLPVDDMVRPLKALADETRLEILALLLDRELYAQQIVQQLQISQSAVSRHLRLMVACDVLNVRKQEGMKFYSINEGTLGSLIQQLESLRNKNA